MTIGKTERNDRKNNRAGCVGDKSDLEGQRGRARKGEKKKKEEKCQEYWDMLMVGYVIHKLNTHEKERAT